MAKYGKKTQEEVEKQLHKHKTQGKWKSRKLALSEAREKGYKTPPPKK